MSMQLKEYDNSWYNPGSKIKIAAWSLCRSLFFNHGLAFFSGWKCFILRIFGATVGKRVVIKPSVNIKYPWFLIIGNDVWIGEKVWIDNLGMVTIENDICISQGAFFLTGNHDYKKPTFDLMIGEITLENGVWIGAKSVVCGGVTCKSHSVLAVCSVATNNLEAYGIYRGNPAQKIRVRDVNEI